MNTMLILITLLSVNNAPPLPPTQVTQVKTLIQRTESQDKNIMAQLVERQKELSLAYAQVELDQPLASGVSIVPGEGG